MLCWSSHFGGVLYLVSMSFGDCIRSFDNCIDQSFISQYAALFLADECVLSALKGFPLNENLFVMYREIYLNNS